MERKAFRWYVIVVLVFAIFSTITLVPPFEKNVGFWIAYAFGVFSIFMQIYFLYFSRLVANDAKSRFYGFPIIRIGIIYFVVQLCVSIIEMFLSTYVQFWVYIITNVVVACLALMGCVTFDIVRNERIGQDEEDRIGIVSFRKLEMMIHNIDDNCSDDIIKKDLGKLCNELKYSDPMTNDKTSEYEIELKELFVDLERCVTEKDSDSSKTLISKAMFILSERNRVCKLTK